MRGIGHALADLLRNLVHRPLSLSEHVHNLSTPATSEGLGNGRERVVEGVLGLSGVEVAHGVQTSI